MPFQVESLGLGQFATDWSRDNRFMHVHRRRSSDRESDLWIAAVPAHTAGALLNSAVVETQGGCIRKAMVCVHLERNRAMEVYVDRFPERGDRRAWLNGGGWPRWAKDGKHLYYLSLDNQLMEAAVRSTPNGLDIAPARPLFRLRPRPPIRLDAYAYDVANDGRFVVNTLVEETTSNAITELFDWTVALEN